MTASGRLPGPSTHEEHQASYLPGKAPVALICVISKVWVWCHLVLLHEQCMMLIPGPQHMDACILICGPQ